MKEPTTTEETEGKSLKHKLKQLYCKALSRRMMCSVIDKENDEQIVAHSPSALVDQTSEELTCPICLEILCNTVTLPCGHNFDRDCLIRMACVSSASTSIACPICREECEQEVWDLRINTLVDKFAALTQPVEYRRKKLIAMTAEEIEELKQSKGGGENEEPFDLPQGFMFVTSFMSLVLMVLVQGMMEYMLRHRLLEYVANATTTEPSVSIRDSVVNVIDAFGLFGASNRTSMAEMPKTLLDIIFGT